MNVNVFCNIDYCKVPEKDVYGKGVVSAINLGL